MATKRVAVFSDVHSNLLALQAVWADIQAAGVDGCWYLGDAIGRGPQPIEALHLLKEIYEASSPEDRVAWLVGNHDWMILNRLPQDVMFGESMSMNRDALYMVGHNQRLLKVQQGNKILLEWLGGLATYADPLPGVHMAHGSYQINDEVDILKTVGEYVWFEFNIREQLEGLRKYKEYPPRILMNGHTHVSQLLCWPSGNRLPVRIENHKDEVHEFEGLVESPIYFNPGSVGFPRDARTIIDLEDNCPTYVILTLTMQGDRVQSARVEFRQVRYDWQPYFRPLTGLMARDGYPERLRKEVQRCLLPDLD